MDTNTTKPSIAVIMSTYNGEKYLREQLDSILNQKDVNLDLYVRDDGSVDGTAEILNQYSKRYPQVHVELAANAGVGNSFMNCLYSVPGEYQYYGFADQDDIWLQDKCIAGISALKRTGKALYSSNQECVDSDGKSLGPEIHRERSYSSHHYGDRDFATLSRDALLFLQRNWQKSLYQNLSHQSS